MAKKTVSLDAFFTASSYKRETQETNINDNFTELYSSAGTLFTVAECAAVTGAATPSGSNVFATMADLPASELTSDEKAAINGASTPSASNVFTTAADVTAVTNRMPAKILKAIITQTSTGAPTAAEMIDEIEGTWARSSAGVYTLTKSGVFTQNMTHILVDISPLEGVGSIKATWTSANVITFTSKNAGGVATDGIITAIPIVIEVWANPA